MWTACMSNIALELQYPKKTEIASTSKHRQSEEPRVTTIPAPPGPPQSPSRSPRTPREQTKKPSKCQYDRPESSATQQRIRRTADFPKPCLPSSSPYHGLHDTGCDPEANGRELTTNVLQQTSGLPRKSLRMPVNARQIAQDSPDRDLRRRMALESQFVSIA